MHLSEDIAECLRSHVAGLTKFRESKWSRGCGEDVQDLVVGHRAGRHWGGRVLEHAKSEVVVGTLKDQGQVVASGGGPMLDGERELIRFSPEVEIGIAPGVKLGASAQGLAGAEMMCGLSGVMDDDHGEAEQTLEFAEVGEDGGDIGRSVFVDAVQANEGVEEEELGLK